MRQLRDFLIEHPLLVVKLGFRLYLDPTQLHGIDVEKTVPKKRWFNAKLHTFNNNLLQDLLAGTVHALQKELGKAMPKRTGVLFFVGQILYHGCSKGF